MSASLLLLPRKFTLGPEDPGQMYEEGWTIVQSRQWLFRFAVGLAGGLSGLMVLFLFLVFVWRRSLVNRISLRLIFLISLFDFFACMLQTRHQGTSLALQIAKNFFIDFFSFGSIYLSASIAFNLQMVFLRKSRAPLPKYVEYLYFVVPLTVCFLHIAPQYIYAGTQGWAISGQDLEPRTPKYMWYVFFVFLFVPYVFVLYNVITSIRVIISLVVKQRAITRVLNLASQETNTLLSGSSSNTVARNSSAAASTVSVTPKERRQLRLARKVYKVSVRIALYPLSPVVTLILLSIFYLQQYFVTLTYKSDVQLFVRLTTMSFFMFPTQAFANFAIFLTDAAVLNVVSEVRRSIRIKMGRKENFQVSDGEMHGPGKTVIRKISAAISESGVSDTMQMESSSFDSFVGEKASIQTDGYFHTPAALEESRPFATAIDGLGDDAVIRRVRASGDAESEYQDLL